MKNKKTLIFGGIVGLIAPILGLFFGLQVSPVLGNTLMLPFVFIAEIINQPFGNFSTSIIVLCFALSTVLWAGFFLLASKIRKNF